MAIGTSDKYKVKNGYINDVTARVDETGYPMSRRNMAYRKKEYDRDAEYAKQTENDPTSKGVNEKNAESAKNAGTALGLAREFRKHAKIVDQINPEGKPVTPTEDYTSVDDIEPYKKGGSVKAKPTCMKKGGAVKSSVSSRGDGCATKGKTKGRII